MKTKEESRKVRETKFRTELRFKTISEAFDASQRASYRQQKIKMDKKAWTILIILLKIHVLQN